MAREESKRYVPGAADVKQPPFTDVERRRNDPMITTKVKMAISNKPSLKVAQINVETSNAVVQLSGFVNSSADIYTAGSVARSAKGVVSVKNGLRLK
jgi:hyperosmotically inducible protein